MQQPQQPKNYGLVGGLIALAMLSAIIAICEAGPPRQAPPAVPLQAPPVMAEICDCYPGGACVCLPGHCECEWCMYKREYRRAMGANQPLIVFIGCPAKYIPGVRILTMKQFPDMAGPGVVVGVPDGAGGMGRVDLSATATIETIRYTAKHGQPPGPAYAPTLSRAYSPAPYFSPFTPMGFGGYNRSDSAGC